MKVFITGATGFVGTHVLAAVNALGHDILASTLEEDKTENNPSNIHWLYGDFSDLKFLRTRLTSFNPDVIIHLAWQGIPDYSETSSRRNLNHSIELIDFILSKTNCKKIIVSGSCWEYGKTQGACKESSLVNIDSYFAWAKFSLYKYLSVKCDKKNVVLNWFRIFYVYGPGQREKSLIPTLIKSIGQSKTPRITSPLNKNDFVYAEDVAKVFAKTIDTDLPSGVYNLGSGCSTSVYDLCRIVEKKLIGTQIISRNIIEDWNQVDIVESIDFWADMTKTRKALNILGSTSLEEGIELYVQSLQTVGLA